MFGPTWSGSLGEVAPGVTKGMPAFSAIGASASTESESVKPTITGTLSWLISWLPVLAITVGSVLVS